MDVNNKPISPHFNSFIKIIVQKFSLKSYFFFSNKVKGIYTEL